MGKEEKIISSYIVDPRVCVISVKFGYFIKLLLINKMGLINSKLSFKTPKMNYISIFILKGHFFKVDNFRLINGTKK